MHNKREINVDNPDSVNLSSLEQHLLNDFQHGLPLSSTPYADMANKLGVSEQQVIDTLQALQQRKLISRVGAVFTPNTIGASTLAAMAVPEGEIEQVAEFINQYEEVNHNYEREHDFNLWFVLTAENETRILSVLAEMESITGYRVLYLPLVEDYHIDLGFDLKWK